MSENYVENEKMRMTEVKHLNSQQSPNVDNQVCLYNRHVILFKINFLEIQRVQATGIKQ